MQIEIGIEKGKSDDLKLLISYLSSSVSVSLVEKEPSPSEEFPYIKVGNEMVHGTKTISLFLCSFSPKLLGVQNLEKAEVEQWITFCNTTIKPTWNAKNLKAIREFARVLNEVMLQRVYFCANFMTVADLLLYANLYPYMKSLEKKQYFEVCNLSRWFDLIQHTENVDLGKPLIEMDLDEITAPQKKGKEKAPEEAKQKGGKGEGKEGKEGKEEKEKEGKKKEKAKEEKPKQEAPQAAGDDITVSKLKLVVGKITEVKKHPDADSLYVETIEVGEEKPRNVVSGLVKFMTPDELMNRLVIVVANMKPANMRGVTSEAMVLCANNQDFTKVEFVEPPKGSAPGDLVFVPGFEGTPESVLNPKKKMFEKIQPDFKTSDSLVATYRGSPFTTHLGVCSVASIAGGNIK